MGAMPPVEASFTAPCATYLVSSSSALIISRGGDLGAPVIKRATVRARAHWPTCRREMSPKCRLIKAVRDISTHAAQQSSATNNPCRCQYATHLAVPCRLAVMAAPISNNVWHSSIIVRTRFFAPRRQHYYYCFYSFFGENT